VGTVLLVVESLQGQGFVSARLTGEVMDLAGAPLAGVTVLVNRTSGAAMSGGLPQTTTDKDGRYELVLRFEHGKTLIVREVFAESKGYARSAPAIELPLAADTTRTLDFTLRKGEVIAGTVKAPPPNIRHVLLVNGPTIAHLSDNARAYLAESNGTFEIYLPPGEYSIQTLTTRQKWERSGVKTGERNVVLEPSPFEWSGKSLGAVFDELWEVMDRSYSYFFLKTNVDWRALKTEFRPKAMQAKSTKELAGVLADMLGPLRDMHVWLETPEGLVPTHRSSYAYNGNQKITLEMLENRVDCGRFASVGKTRIGGFGYFLMRNQSAANPEDVKKAVAAMKQLRDTPGFIVDLRRANGGSEPMAIEIARFFCSRDTVYARHKYRNGPRHTDFGSENERILPGSANAYTNPVVCLVGRGAVSSGEGFVKMMKCLPHVTTVGQRTRGASGNPKPLPLGETGITLYFSRWVDLMPNGRTFEGAGIPPDVEVNEPPEAYANSDPTLEKGLEVLRRRFDREIR
jgi:hypothetical protein